MGNTGTASSP